MIEHMFDMMDRPHIGVRLGNEGFSPAVAKGVATVTKDVARGEAAAILPGRGRDPLQLQPGRVTELVGDPGTGLTRLGLRLLAPHSRVAPVVALDTRGWISPEAAWETGVLSERFVVVRCDDPLLWPKVMAALFEGVRAVYAEVPARVRDQDLRRLAALARARQVAVALRVMRGGLPTGVAFLRLRAIGVTWEGADRGHGQLTRRRLVLEATGKGAAGITRRFEVEDEGTDVVRVVSDVVVDQARRAAG
jgi:hypothetical protein